MTTDFGAIPDDEMSDQCAFENASYYFSNDNVPRTLIIPKGTYNVGAEYTGSGYMYMYGGVLCLEDAENKNIIGELNNDGSIGVHIKFDDCLRYGAFDFSQNPVERYLTLPGINFDRTIYGASPGNMIDLKRCTNINIENIELNGNADKLSIGGRISETTAIVAHCTGLYLNLCQTVKIENVFSHDFAFDGINIDCDDDDGIFPRMDIRLIRSRFNNNRRSGMSWTGGSTVFALECDFNSNGLGTYSCPSRDGVDIEWDAGSGNQLPVTNGIFTDCRFMYNFASGVESQGGTHAPDQNYTFRFKNCLFVASEFGKAVWPNARDMKFTCCNFYGQTQAAYNDNDISHPTVSNWSTKFYYCGFHEEFDDGSNVFSFNLDNFDESVLCNSTGWCTDNGHPTSDFDDCWHNPHEYLINWQLASNALLYNCTLESNLQMRLMYLQGGTGPFQMDYRIVLFDCQFINYGMSTCNGSCGPTSCGGGDASLGYVDRVAIAGNNQIWRSNPVRNDPINNYSYQFQQPSINSVLDVFGIPVWFNGTPYFQNLPFCTFNTCQQKYTNPPVPFTWVCVGTSNTDEYCIDQSCSTKEPCTCAYPLDPVCFPEFKSALGESRDSANVSTKDIIKVIPNPSSREVFISNLNYNEEVLIVNTYGAVVKRIIAHGTEISIDISDLSSGVWIVDPSNHKPIILIKFE